MRFYTKQHPFAYGIGLRAHTLRLPSPRTARLWCLGT